jgi:hypothetical protein
MENEDLVEVTIAAGRSAIYQVDGENRTAGPGETIRVSRADEKMMRSAGYILDPDGSPPPAIVIPMRVEANPGRVGLQSTTTR